MSRINTPPIGLQSLLGSQSMGDNPDNLLQDVRPTVNMLPFWGVHRMEAQTTVGNRSSPGDIVSLGNFGGPTRMILGAQIYGQVPAGGGNIKLGIYLRGVNGLSATESLFIAENENQQTLVAQDWHTLSWQPRQPLILEPEISIHAFAQVLTFAYTGTLVVWYYDLQS